MAIMIVSIVFYPSIGQSLCLSFAGQAVFSVSNFLLGTTSRTSCNYITAACIAWIMDGTFATLFEHYEDTGRPSFQPKYHPTFSCGFPSQIPYVQISPEA